eukprot:m51a1_g3163 hypothetical protein (691) ;mRNA; r:374637-377531
MLSEASLSLREKMGDRHGQPESAQRIKEHLEARNRRKPHRAIEEARAQQKSVYKKLLRASATARDAARETAAVAAAWLDYSSSVRRLEPDKSELATSLYQASELQKAMAECLNALSGQLQSSVALAIKDFVKGDIRTARYSRQAFEKTRISYEAADERLRSEAFEDAQSQVVLLMSDTRHKCVYTTMQRVCDLYDAYDAFLRQSREAMDRAGPAVDKCRASAAAMRKQHAAEARGSRCIQQYFGFPLKALLQRENRNEAQMPTVIEQALAALNSSTDVEGLFRISANKSDFKDVQRQVELGVQIDWAAVDPHVTSNIVKAFVRDLPEPLLLQDMQQQWIDCAKESEGPLETRVTKLRALVQRLPAEHAVLLKSLLVVLRNVAQCPASKMTAMTLGTCLGPNLLYDASPDMSLTMAAPSVVAMLIENVEALFPGSCAECLPRCSPAVSPAATEHAPASSPAPPQARASWTIGSKWRRTAAPDTLKPVVDEAAQSCPSARLSVPADAQPLPSQCHQDVAHEKRSSDISHWRGDTAKHEKKLSEPALLGSAMPSAQPDEGSRPAPTRPPPNLPARQTPKAPPVAHGVASTPEQRVLSPPESPVARLGAQPAMKPQSPRALPPHPHASCRLPVELPSSVPQTKPSLTPLEPLPSEDDYKPIQIALPKSVPTASKQEYQSYDIDAALSDLLDAKN